MKRLLIALLTIATASALSGQQEPLRERGFKPDQLYQFNGFDSVNLFNGNLNLAVPLGPSYPVGAGVSYSFSLRYSGNVWKTVGHCTPTERETGDCALAYLLQPADNVGPGWRLSFGELRAPVTNARVNTAASMWEYKSPDASEHYFYPTLYEPICTSSIQTDCDSVSVGFGYTRDGTYLRLREEPNAVTVEFGSGQRQRFTLNATKWKLQYIYSASSTLVNGIPTSNYVKFEYPPSAYYGGVSDWKVTDSHGREHRVYFQPGGVDKIEIAAFVRPLDAPDVKATYDFTYGNYTIGTDGKPVDGPSVSIREPCDARPLGNFQTMSFLSRVDLPSAEQYKFAYHQPTSTCDDTSATLTEATLPTGGGIAWQYQIYGFVASPLDYAAGVKERLVKNAAGTVIQKTTYEFADQTADGHNVIVRPCRAWSTGTPCTPESETKYHFTTGQETTTGYGPRFGLPVSPTSGVSTEMLVCNPACSTRTTYLTHEFDYTTVPSTCNFQYPCVRDRGRRIVWEKTVYGDDGDRYADTTYSLFDGLGHYRKTVTGGDFSSGNVRTTETNYNSHSRAGGSVGIYALTSTGSRAAGYTSLQSTDPWILGTHGGAYTLENGMRSDVTTCFDAPTGFLKRQRTLAGPTNEARATDLLAVFTLDSLTGYVAREEFFGGDKRETGEPNLPLTDLCTFTLPTHDKYSFRIDHTYQYGVLKTSAYKRADETSMPFVSVQDAIDRNTGFVASSTDPAGVVTTYRYDRSGRLDLVDQPADGLADTSYAFFGAATNSSASVTVSMGAGLTKASGKYEFDSIGRVWREHQLMPDGSWSVTETQYDALGRRSWVSEQETYTGMAFTPVKKTVFSGYDAFGRIGSILGPDGKTIAIAYSGDRITTKTTDVATGLGSVTPAVTVEERDRAGRLWKITENGSDSTTYGYDGNGRVTTVTMGNQPSRVFTYDGRGFLLSERHPESGTTTYQYDARGHVVKRVGGVAELTTEYDRAERVLSVFQEGGGSLDGVLKEFAYDRPNSGDDYSRGKVAEAVRHNRSVALGDVMIKEKYIYATRAGMLSGKTTTISTLMSGVPTQGGQFSDQYQYTDLGDVGTLTYPACTTGCTGQTGVARAISSTFTHGRVTEVAPYTKEITYHPNGLLHEVRHANVNLVHQGVLYTQTIANGMSRPDEILVEGFCDGTNLSITTQPESGTAVAVGSAAALTVEAAGATEWQWYKVVGSTSVILGDQTGYTLTSAVSEETTYWVRVGNGNCSVDSNPATVFVSTCAAPVPVITVSPAIVPRNGAGTASVSVTTGATYAWSISSGGAIASPTSLPAVNFSIDCTGAPVTLTVTVTAPCNRSGTTSKSIPIGLPPAVTLSADPAPMPQQGGSKTIHASITASAASSWLIQWSDQAQSISTSAASFDRVVTPTETKQYTLTVLASAGCSAFISNPVTVTVTPPAPTGITATAVSSSNINVSWSFVGTSDQFRIERRGPGQASFAQVGLTNYPAISYVDASAVADTAYLYRVTAVKAGTSSAPSGVDLATTVIFAPDPIAFLTEVSTQPILQLRTAVIAVRALWSTAAGPAVFTDPSLIDVSPKAVHILELRSFLAAVRSNLNLPALQYTGPDPQAGQLFNSADINDLRGGVR